ncbi:MAG: hypothetical protein M1814_006388 [Vezdaea aestivalis]|nr:MAG: hypothetical protein M1814_006388 [Vezdaea aestivalis]
MWSHQEWLSERNRLTEVLKTSKYDFHLYIKRAYAHKNLGFPDLAVGDADKALLLTNELVDDGAEYHDEVLAAATLAYRNKGQYSPVNSQIPLADLVADAQPLILECYHLQAESLLDIGCLKSAASFCNRGLLAFPGDSRLQACMEQIFNLHRERNELALDTKVDIDQLSEQGWARREVYPWNDKEPDRFFEGTLAFLNEKIAKVAPKCEVRAIQLPTLSTPSLGTLPETNLQLGVFAKEEIAAGETILRESSVLTASNRIDDPFCDACSTPLESLGTSNSTNVACPDCDDAIFCSEGCLKDAVSGYHAAVCGDQVDILSGEPPSVKYSADTLYLLLLQRALTMAVTQDTSPLLLNETRYIWGDFSSLSSTSQTAPRTLPFTYYHNIFAPLAILSKMDINPFSPSIPDLSELWVHNTLLAKFRGTASALLSPVSGKLETAAVHPLWCLANHDCDPNVAWDWRKGKMRFWVRGEAELVRGSQRKGLLEKGDEIRSHYCDVAMGVKERREWAMGSLGGNCLCERCIREDEELEAV